MSDNKLKIRIQIQQPPQAIEQIYPELPEPVIIYEQSLDWKKISIAALLLSSILALTGYFVFDSNKSEVPLKEAVPSITPTLMHENKISAEEASPALETKDDTIEPRSNETPGNFSGLNQPEVTREIKAMTASIPKPKPDLIRNEPAATGGKIPKTVTQPKPQRLPDHPLVHKAQFSHAIKAREPADAIDTVQLRQGESKPIYFYLHLKNLQGEKVSILWYHQNKLDSQLTLQIHNNNWRTYASKQLDHRRLGAWRVELMDKSGNRMAMRHFTVTTH